MAIAVGIPLLFSMDVGVVVMVVVDSLLVPKEKNDFLLLAPLQLALSSGSNAALPLLLVHMVDEHSPVSLILVPWPEVSEVEVDLS